MDGWADVDGRVGGRLSVSFSQLIDRIRDLRQRQADLERKLRVRQERIRELEQHLLRAQMKGAVAGTANDTAWYVAFFIPPAAWTPLHDSHTARSVYSSVPCRHAVSGRVVRAQDGFQSGGPIGMCLPLTTSCRRCLSWLVGVALEQGCPSTMASRARCVAVVANLHNLGRHQKRCGMWPWEGPGLRPAKATRTDTFGVLGAHYE